ncbi:hypothetical protein AOLI_G00035890 [Acnodon oligacanthus]
MKLTDGEGRSRGTQAVEALNDTAALETGHRDRMYPGNEILDQRLASQSSRSNCLSNVQKADGLFQGQKWKIWFLEWSAAYSIVVMIGTVFDPVVLGKTQPLSLNRLCTQGSMYGFDAMQVYTAYKQW